MEVNISMNEENIVCVYCECDFRVHCFYLKCPLFENESICVDCCFSMDKEDVVSKLEEVTSVKRSREQIDQICKDCNKRGA